MASVSHSMDPALKNMAQQPILWSPKETTPTLNMHTMHMRSHPMEILVDFDLNQLGLSLR